MQNNIHRKTAKKAKRIVIKIGSGILTTDKGLRTSFFKSLAKEIVTLRKRKIEVAIVSSGAIACGMGLLKQKKRPQNISQKQATAAIGQPRLMQHYSKAFERAGVHVAQILLTRDDLHNKQHFMNARHAFAELFRSGAVAIVNENDSVGIEEIKVGDNDQLSAFVAHLINADLLILCTDTNGFYEKNPKKHKGAKRIPLVKKIDKKTFARAEGTENQRSTGGMITKLLAAKQAAACGIPTWVVKGDSPKVLHKILDGKDIGTLFLTK